MRCCSESRRCCKASNDCCTSSTEPGSSSSAGHEGTAVVAFACGSIYFRRARNLGVYPRFAFVPKALQITQTMTKLGVLAALSKISITLLADTRTGFVVSTCRLQTGKERARLLSLRCSAPDDHWTMVWQGLSCMSRESRGSNREKHQAWTNDMKWRSGCGDKPPAPRPTIALHDTIARHFHDCTKWNSQDVVQKKVSQFASGVVFFCTGVVVDTANTTPMHQPATPGSTQPRSSIDDVSAC